MKVSLQKPNLDRFEIEAVSKVIESGWVTQGEMVDKFEKMFANYIGVKHAIAVSNCSVALYLVLKTLGIKKGDQVITSAYSFIATINAIVHVGARPILIDVDPQTCNIDVNRIEYRIKKNTKAILAVDNFGYPVNYNRIRKIAEDHKLSFIADSACALGSKYYDQLVGGQADVHCFSFHPRKVITTGEGGMITTNNDVLADKLRILRSHGYSISDLERHKAAKIVFEKYPLCGYNFRMTDIQAAIGNVQMTKLGYIIMRRNTVAMMYNNAFRQQKNLTIPFTNNNNIMFNYQSYQLRVANHDRDLVMQKLFDKGISTRCGNQALHKQICHKSLSELNFPIAERAADTSIILPLYPDITNDQVKYVIENVLEICK